MVSQGRALERYQLRENQIINKIVNNHFRQADSKSVEMCNSTLHTLPAYGPEISIFIKKGFVSVDCALILKKVT